MKLLLVDKKIMDASFVIESVNADTLPILYSFEMSRLELLDLLQDITSIDRIGLLFTQGNANLFLENQHFFVKENEDFLIYLINKYKTPRIDYLACNTLAYPAWQNYFSRIKEATGVIVGASYNKTGNIRYGGDWVMENTSENIELVYFTNQIEYYTYVLDEPVVVPEEVVPPEEVGKVIVLPEEVDKVTVSPEEVDKEEVGQVIVPPEEVDQVVKLFNKIDMKVKSDESIENVGPKECAPS
jgi:hypothetical protein